jgi:O-antigen/teichoic acid export membrane protein
MRRLGRSGFPLLLNSLLLTVFFRFDAVILRAVAGDAVLGLYDAAYKVIAMTQIIPPYVVGALFPLLAQRAAHQRELLAPLVARAIGVLQWVAWFGVVIITLMADELIWVLGGKAYLPGAAQALRVLIWYLPLSYTTGVLQYALIAIQRQKTITLAFAVGTIVNIGCNLVLIPYYGAIAAAAVTIATEVALMVAVWPTLRAAGLYLPWRTLLVASGGAIVVIAIGFLVRQWTHVPAIVITLGAVCMLAIIAFWSGTLDNAIMNQVQRLMQRIKTRLAR